MTSTHNSPSHYQLTRRVGWIPPGGATTCHLQPQPAQHPGTSGLGLGAGYGVVGGGGHPDVIVLPLFLSTPDRQASAQLREYVCVCVCMCVRACVSQYTRYIPDMSPTLSYLVMIYPVLATCASHTRVYDAGYTILTADTADTLIAPLTRSVAVARKHSIVWFWNKQGHCMASHFCQHKQIKQKISFWQDRITRTVS